MIYLDDPNISLNDVVEVQKALFTNQISTVGEHIGLFEKAVVDYLNTDVFCIGTNSGSAALYVALKVLGIGAGDEVIIPATTFVATAHAVTMTGARPVVVDIDPNTWNIDPAEIEKAITIKTKAIIPVHLYGNPCDMDAILKIADDNDLFVIEDACESLGATYMGKHTGTIGHIGCFSFNRNKVITCGGGGMLITKDKHLADKARQFVNQGRDNDGNVVGHGFNFGMVNQNAALGLSQMDNLGEWLYQKYNFNKGYYQYRLLDNKNISFQDEYKDAHPSYWFTAIKIDTIRVGKLIPQIQEELKAKGIPTRRIFKPLKDLPNAWNLWEKGLCLPSSTLNTLDDIEYVAKTLLEVLS